MEGVKFKNNDEDCVSMCATCKYKPTGNFPLPNFQAKANMAGYPNMVCDKGFSLGTLIADDSNETHFDVAQCDHHDREVDN